MGNPNPDNENWDQVIVAKQPWLDLNLKAVWRYRYLIALLVKRDFATIYKQTILGPLWYIVTPLITTIVFTVIFGRIAKMPTDGIPPFLFYLAGNVAWGYFANCFSYTSNVFVGNIGLFGKVYFPRLTVPIATIAISLLKFAIQFVLFLGIYAYFVARGSSARPTFGVLLLGVVVFQMAVLGIGMGMLISSLTTKYRDLTFVMTFAVNIWMYLTPVIYPASTLSAKKQMLFMLANPMSSIVECFRWAMLGSGLVELPYICASWSLTIAVFFLGLILFNRIEKTFLDTV